MTRCVGTTARGVGTFGTENAKATGSDPCNLGYAKGITFFFQSAMIVKLSNNKRVNVVIFKSLNISSPLEDPFYVK